MCRVEVPEDYKLDSLTTLDVSTVNGAWKFGQSEESAVFLAYLVATFPSLCYRWHGAPVAWILTTQYGSLGMLHVAEPHRRKGLATSLICRLAQKHLEDGHQPYAIIDINNQTSFELFSKCGFRKIPDLCVNWLVCKPES